jgi:hypothetical protein
LTNASAAPPTATNESAGPVTTWPCGRWDIVEADESTGSCQLVEGPARDSHPGAELQDWQAISATGAEVGTRQLVRKGSADPQPLGSLADRQQLQLVSDVARRLLMHGRRHADESGILTSLDHSHFQEEAVE